MKMLRIFREYPGFWWGRPVACARPLVAPLLILLLSISYSLPLFAGADKETPPQGSTPKPFKLASTEDFTLPNGMRVTMAPYGVIPKVAIQAYVDAGGVRDPADKIWISKLTALLIKEGTAKRSGEQIASDAADMGGQLDITATNESARAGATVLSDYAPQFVALLADVLSNATLPAADLSRLKTDLLRQLAVQRSQPNFLAREKFLQVMFPDQPYGQIFPTSEALSAYTLDGVRTFFNENYAASRTHLYVVGQFDPATKDAIQQAFGSWKRGQGAPFPPAKPVSQYSLQLIDRPGAAQSTVYLGLPVANPKTPDYIPLDVMDSLLGGSFASRITSNIREQKGYTYSPFSMVTEAGYQSYWAEIADVTTAVTGPSLQEIFGEVNRLRKEPPPKQELDGIKNYLSGIFVIRNNISPNAVIAQLHFVDSQELDRSFLVNYVQNVSAVSPADVQRIAETYISPSKMTVVVVGDKAKISDQLKPFETAP
jgi:zinc protease